MKRNNPVRLTEEEWTATNGQDRPDDEPLLSKQEVAGLGHTFRASKLVERPDPR